MNIIFRRMKLSTWEIWNQVDCFESHRAPTWGDGCRWRGQPGLKRGPHIIALSLSPSSSAQAHNSGRPIPYEIFLHHAKPTHVKPSQTKSKQDDAKPLQLSPPLILGSHHIVYHVQCLLFIVDVQYDSFKSIIIHNSQSSLKTKAMSPKQLRLQPFISVIPW